MKKITKLKMLTACMLLAQHSYALEQLSDSTLSSVTGQDGITITHEVSKITIDQANWVDFSDNSSMRLGLHGVEVKGVNNSNIKSQIDLDVAGTTNGAGIRLETTISPFEATNFLLYLKSTSVFIFESVSKTIFPPFPPSPPFGPPN